MIDVAALRDAHPIAAVVERAGVELRPSGRRLVGRCPLHEERRPSFTVYPDTHSFYCFGCEVGGDVISFVAHLHNLDFRGAVALLDPTARDHRPLPERRPGAGRHGMTVPPSPGREPDTPTRAVIAAAADYYHARLWHSPAALTYLAGRGVSPQAARRHHLGYVPGHGLARRLDRLGLDRGAAETVGLLRGGREPFAGRVAIPDLRDTQATWLTGRALGGTGPRYLSVRLPAPLLGLAQVPGDDILVVEGPFDRLTAWGWGVPAVALLGTRVSTATVAALARFRRIYTALDADEAGARATGTLRDALGDRVVPVQLPQGAGDVNDLAGLPNGRERFLAALRASGYGAGVRGTDVARTPPRQRAA